MVTTLDKYSAAMVLLLSAGVLFLAIPLFVRLGDLSNAVFVLAGLTCIMGGCFVLIFAGNEPFNPRHIGLFSPQGCMNLCRLAADYGVHGKAYFLPPHITGEARIMQFNPVSTHHWSVNLFRKASEEGTTWSEYSLPPRTSGEARNTQGLPSGLVMIPLSNPLLLELLEQNALVIPDRMDKLNVLLSETISDVFEFAPNVSTLLDGNTVTITLHDFSFINGCVLIQSEEPQCCSRYPCPVCSLCGSLITECTNKVVTLEKCSVTSPNDVTAVFYII
jgi:hypothetical protein